MLAILRYIQSRKHLHSRGLWSRRTQLQQHSMNGRTDKDHEGLGKRKREAGSSRFKGQQSCCLLSDTRKQYQINLGTR